ncbi:MAG: HD domain-containing protein [Candidatus Micrarchaeota archaeon]|nr:HD domain-containing protein [Candidatus Micrarchaeota archaeon]
MEFKFTDKHVRLAKAYSRKAHEGQYRMSGPPFITHPRGVAKILARHGYGDRSTQVTAYLHDAFEQGRSVSLEEVGKLFGAGVAKNVFLLSRTTREGGRGKLGRKEYLRRLSLAPAAVKRVKIADAIHNSRDLELVDAKNRKRLVRDAESHYIPWGKKDAPSMARELEGNIERYRQIAASMRRLKGNIAQYKRITAQMTERRERPRR